MEEKGSNLKKVLTQLFKYIIFYKKKLIIIIILTILSTVLGVLTPYLLSYIIDNILGKNMYIVFKYAVILLSIYFINIFISRKTNLFMLNMSENILYNIRNDLFISLENLPLSFFDKNSKGDIMSRFTSDMELIGDVLSESLIESITSIFTFIGTLIMIFSLNVPLSIVTIFTVPLFFIGAIKIGLLTGNTYKKQQEDIGNINSYFEEYVTNMKIVNEFDNSENIKKSFKEKNELLRKDEVDAQFYSNLIISLNNIISNFGNFLIIVVGIILVLKGDITIGIIFAFISYASMFRSPIQTLATVFTSTQSALAGAERIFNIMNEKSNIIEVNHKKDIKSINEISFEEVSFGYNEKDILENISFTLKKNQSLAIVGKTGSGKTTLINLLLRLYDVKNGSILINGIDIKEISFNSLYKEIGVILQEPFLFEGTILDNLIYGNQITNNNKIIKASKETGLHDFIEKLPNGYNFYIEENGSNLSVGEKQLIAITRIVLRDPSILILDEATSSTDLYTESKVYSAMMKLMEKKTTIVIAHRLKTIKKSDSILFLKDGKIKEKGTHDELLNKKGDYYSLYMTQFL